MPQAPRAEIAVALIVAVGEHFIEIRRAWNKTPLACVTHTPPDARLLQLQEAVVKFRIVLAPTRRLREVLPKLAVTAAVVAGEEPAHANR